jgi:NADH:ubiquinone oxidoreductase subunit 3 (subunit A)
MSSQLQNLSSQFNTLLSQYTEMYNNYINVVNSNDTSFTAVPDTSFVGQSNISVLNGSSINDCASSCLNNSSCSGATFNNNSSSCTLSSGSGNIVSTPQSTSIVKQALYYSYQLQQLNSQLMAINQQMISTSNNNFGQFQQTQQQNQEKEIVLQNNYQTLTHERMQIEEMIRQFETLNAAYENGNINVTSNYYSYIVLLFVVIFLVGLLMKFSLPGKNEELTWLPLFGISLICIFLVYILVKRG